MRETIEVIVKEALEAALGAVRRCEVSGPMRVRPASHKAQRLPTGTAYLVTAELLTIGNVKSPSGEESARAGMGRQIAVRTKDLSNAGDQAWQRAAAACRCDTKPKGLPHNTLSDRPGTIHHT